MLWLLNFWKYSRQLWKLRLFSDIEVADIATLRVQYELDPERYL